MATTAVVSPQGSVHYQSLTGAANTLTSNTAPGSVIVSTEAMTVTIPESTTVDWPLGTQLFIVNDGDHITTVAKTGSDTIDGDLVGPAFAGTVAVCTKVAATAWVVGQSAGA